MASVSIAKATLLASCLRRDEKLEPISRNELTEFHDSLEKTILVCNNLNIQKTKAWIVKHILPSSARTAALSKYITTLSKNIPSLFPNSPEVRQCRQQLHLTYLLNDVLHHAQYHSHESDVCKHTRDHIAPILTQIFANAVTETRSRTRKRLQDLIEIWQKEQLCGKEILEDLRESIISGKDIRQRSEEQDNNKPKSRDLPWMMPTTHGDPNAPYFDLPAANLMPHIVPNSTRPIRSDQVRALRLAPGPADESLVNALKDFLKDVRSIENPYVALEDEGIIPEIDEMGQVTYTNEADDNIKETYYGWSKEFCEKMKNRDKDDVSSRNSRSPSRGRSSTRSRSRSRSPINGQASHGKRKRYSRSRSSNGFSSRDQEHSRIGPESLSRRPDSQRPPQLQSFPPAPLHQYRPIEHPGSHLPPPPRLAPPTVMNFGNGPPQPLHSTLIHPPKPPNWPANLPWPPPPPPPPQSFNFHGYGSR